MEADYKEFVAKLKKLYGEFDKEGKKFVKAPNSEISRNLGYSDAQFSRLINEHATEGEYQRANQNADRILLLISLEKELAQFKNSNPRKSIILKSALALIIGIIIGLLVNYLYGLSNEIEPKIGGKDASKYDILKWSFETPFINPYTKLRDLPFDCNFPCYKYQGKWELKKGYKLPFLRERSGFHYSAVSAVMYARCADEGNTGGKNLEGFEYQLHEIWYDMRELPIDSFMMDNGLITKFYKELDFDQDENFIKIATIHTFYKDKFLLGTEQIDRSGKDIARDIEFISTSELSDIIDDKDVLDDLRHEINLITSNPLLEFSQPSSCNPATVPNTDFNSIRDGDQMIFECQMTSSRAVINYTKSFELTDQYIKDVCRVDKRTN
ncbi:MAG: hypothetical protein ACI9P5_002981 [Saprospiraceae bacterium]|jgi:hypothetical protein